jgi:hypothetical protein
MASHAHEAAPFNPPLIPLVFMYETLTTFFPRLALSNPLSPSLVFFLCSLLCFVWISFQVLVFITFKIKQLNFFIV